MCHTWSEDKYGMILVCADNGEMLVLDCMGQLQASILDAPKGRSIDACFKWSKGFGIAVEDNLFFYEADSDNERVPAYQIGDSCKIKMAGKETFSADRNNNIQCLIIPSQEDSIFAITQQGQIIYTEFEIADFEA
jgi:hypothetical protein